MPITNLKINHLPKLTKMKKIQTTVSTGDIFTGIDGITYKVGKVRTFDGKRQISLHVSINEVSGYTKQVTTRELNKLIG